MITLFVTPVIYLWLVMVSGTCARSGAVFAQRPHPPRRRWRRSAASALMASALPQELVNNTETGATRVDVKAALSWGQPSFLWGGRLRTCHLDRQDAYRPTGWKLCRVEHHGSSVARFLDDV